MDAEWIFVIGFGLMLIVTIIDHATRCGECGGTGETHHVAGGGYFKCRKCNGTGKFNNFKQ